MEVTIHIEGKPQNIEVVPIFKLKGGDLFKMVTLEVVTPNKPSKPARYSTTVYVYDGYNRSNRSWDWHKFDDTSDFGGTRNKNKNVTTDFIF